MTPEREQADELLSRHITKDDCVVFTRETFALALDALRQERDSLKAKLEAAAAEQAQIITCEFDFVVCCHEHRRKYLSMLAAAEERDALREQNAILTAESQIRLDDCYQWKNKFKKLQAEYDQEVISHDIEEKDLKAQLEAYRKASNDESLDK